MIHDQPANEHAGTSIRLSPDDLRAARRLLRLLTDADSPTRLTAQQGLTETAVLTARAQDEFQNRRLRADLFGNSMFGEAAWDMLLVLYILDRAGPRQTVKSLIEYTKTPLTTASRWLDFLVDRALVCREPHPTDGRIAFVMLAPKGREKLDLYFSETVRTGV